jgi:YD repeat-containing protein
LLTARRGSAVEEIYRYVERPAPHYRLEGVRWKSGSSLGLRYEHERKGSALLSELILKEGGQTVGQLVTRVDTEGRIREIWQVEEGSPKRQLASYTYLPRADGREDLLLAQDENGAHWTYEYEHHLMKRYTDRSGRGMNLEWDGVEANARAVREWSDDGSFDVRLEWSDRIRRVTVRDAEGNVTRHYYDILGYTYRIEQADHNDEWFFRDDRKNIIRHLGSDGRSNEYDWDDRDNLIRHTRPDGGTVYFEYDDEDNLTGIEDAEGGIWRREYDGRGNLTAEVDPLGNRTEHRYDKQNRLIEVVDAKGGKKTLAYTKEGQLKSHTDCSGKKTSWGYDERGRVIWEKNAAGEMRR